MADNRPNPRVSIRTPFARVQGLGSAHHGVEHWWQQRLSALANIPLVVAFLIIVASVAGRPYPEAVRILSNPFVAILLGLGAASVCFHMRLGLQIVIEDYVHARLPKFVCGIVNTFFTVAIAAICLFSVLKVSFGRVPMPPL